MAKLHFWKQNRLLLAPSIEAKTDLIYLSKTPEMTVGRREISKQQLQGGYISFLVE